MINLSAEFRRALYDDNRSYLLYAKITLADGTVLDVTNDDIWEDGFSIDDAVSQNDEFSVGGAIINEGKLTLNNIYNKFSSYDFTDARVVMSVGLALSSETEKHNRITGNVSEATYDGSFVNLTILDDMTKFDKVYDSELAYPATITQIITDACTKCSVLYGNGTIPNGDFTISESPADGTITYREVVSYCAQIAGCFARCTPDGKLELKWYDIDALTEAKANLDGGTFAFTDGDTADGGVFKDWPTGYVYDAGSFLSDATAGVHYIGQTTSHDIGVDDIVITGVRVTVKTSDNGSANDEVSCLSGSEGYVLNISGNDLITESTYKDVADYLAGRLVGLTFRRADISILSDPSYEAGDVAVYVDEKGNEYSILVSSTTFSSSSDTTVVCSAKDPARNSAERYTDAAKTYSEIRSRILREKTQRELALENLSQKLSEHSGLYSTIEKADSGNIYYFHDQPTLSGSTIVWKMTSEAWGVSTDGGQTWNGGMTVDGDTIVRILQAVGVNADWIKAGILSDVKGLNYWNLETGEFSSISVNSRIADNAEAIGDNKEAIGAESGRATAAEEKLSSRIKQTAKDISFTVSNGSTTSGITITVTKEDGTESTLQGQINMSGLVSFSNLSTPGKTEINGDNITTGTIKSSDGKSYWDLTTGDFVTEGSGDTVTGLRLKDGVIHATKSGKDTGASITVGADGNIWFDGSVGLKGGTTATYNYVSGVALADVTLVSPGAGTWVSQVSGASAKTSLSGGGVSLSGGSISLEGGGVSISGGGVSLTGGGVSLSGGGVSVSYGSATVLTGAAIGYGGNLRTTSGTIRYVTDVRYSSPTVQYSQPGVNYSRPSVSYTRPSVRYSWPGASLTLPSASTTCTLAYNNILIPSYDIKHVDVVSGLKYGTMKFTNGFVTSMEDSNS